MIHYTLTQEEKKMKPINKEVLKIAAQRMMFDLSDSEYDALLDEFDIFLKQVDILNEIPGIDNVEPMTFPFDVTFSYMRKDEAEHPLKVEEVLKNVDDVVDNQIRLPKVVK